MCVWFKVNAIVEGPNDPSTVVSNPGNEDSSIEHVEDFKHYTAIYIHSAELHVPHTNATMYLPKLATGAEPENHCLVLQPWS